MKSKQVGTPLFLSPEIVKKQAYDHRTDIFSLGVVMYYMAALEVPFNDKSIEGLMNKILYKQPLPFHVTYSQGLREFIFGMLEKNKSKRAFVIDLFPCFPKNYFKIQNPVDESNYNAYMTYKDAMDRKRAIDGNKIKIQENYDILKKRFQGDILEQKKQRAQLQVKAGATNPYEQFEKEEMLRKKRIQTLGKRTSSKLNEIEPNKKDQTGLLKLEPNVLSTENLRNFDILNAK